MYTSHLWSLLYNLCVCVFVWLYECERVHACVYFSLSCDWLNDFLKGYRATISFWHLITVRSHCAPADPLWYGPCTCPSPLSQVPIIIIKLPSTSTSSTSTVSCPTCRRHVAGPHGSSVEEEEGLICSLFWQTGRILWPSLEPVGSLILHQALDKRVSNPITAKHARSYTRAVALCKGVVTVGTNGFGRQSFLPPRLSHSCTPDTFPSCCGDSEGGSPDKGYPFPKRPKVKSEPGFQIIFSDWLGLPFSEMNY